MMPKAIFELDRANQTAFHQTHEATTFFQILARLSTYQAKPFEDGVCVGIQQERSALAVYRTSVKKTFSVW